MARAIKLTTSTAAVTAQLLGGGSASIFYGLTATGAGNAAAYYIKFWWEGTGTAAPTASLQAPSTTTPVAGTTVPHLTVAIPVAGLPPGSTVEPINNGGRIWYWVTTSLADNAATVLAAGGDVITVFVD